jgi:hypothetical protein
MLSKLFSIIILILYILLYGKQLIFSWKSFSDNKELYADIHQIHSRVQDCRRRNKFNH